MKIKIYSILYKIFIYCIGLFSYVKSFNKTCDCLFVNLYRNNYNNIANNMAIDLMHDFIVTINEVEKYLSEAVNG